MELLTTTTNLTEAHRISKLLEGAGIKPFIPDDTMMMISRHQVIESGPIEIKVKQSDLPRAIELLAQFRSGK